MPSSIVGILLAAGSATRFGGGKLLAHLADGTPVGLASWRSLSDALDTCLVVVRTGDAATTEMYRGAGARIVECADAEKGMSRSLIAGINAAGSDRGWLIALADMPFVSAKTIAAVAGAIEDGALIAMPEYRGERGHPVGFSARLQPELLGIDGDEGARTVVRRHAGEVRTIPTRDAGILRDIDTPGDLENR